MKWNFLNDHNSTYHHILESSGSDNKKLPPRKVGSTTELERSHALPIEVTENIEALRRGTLSGEVPCMLKLRLK